METVAAKQKSEEKKDFSPEEHDRAKAACEFVIELTKAISRSGYYDADHPVSQEVKKGLYDHFQKIMGKSPELMLTCHETEEGADIHISGILNEPFNIRKLTHATTSDLFVPKLKDYFERKSLNSFAIKKSITPEHFEAFIDVMSEPMAESADPSKLGEYLTKTLAELNITEISTVFKTDIILARGKLPWRVSIILRRLAKDLKVIPLFRDASEEKIKLIKKQIIEDIIRPLNNSGLLKDLLVNCDMIIEHVHHLMEIDELETTMIHVLPISEVLPVTKEVYDFYQNYSAGLEKEESEKETRKLFLEKILRIAAGKIFSEKISGASGLIDRLYEEGILHDEDLPEEFKFHIETRALAEKMIGRLEFYLEQIKQAPAEKIRLVFDDFQRAMTELIKKKEWTVIEKIFQAVEDRAGDQETALAPTEGERASDYLLKDSREAFAYAYVTASAEERKAMNAILIRLEETCVKIADTILDLSKDSEVFRNIAGLLSQKGDCARQWALKTLENQAQAISRLNIAMMVLMHVGTESDFPLIKKYLKYPNHSIRNRALSTAVKLNKKESESFVLDALNDEHDVVRENAASLIEREIVPSELSANKILIFVKSKLEDKKNLTEKEAFYLSSIIRPIARNLSLVRKESLENALLDIVSDLWKGKTGVLKFIKAEPSPAEKEIISACLLVLGKIGSEKTGDYLKAVAKGAGVLSEEAARALEEVNRRKKTA